MAVSIQIVCSVCKEERYVTYSARGYPPSICSACKQKEEDSKRTSHLEKLKTLPIEERIERIEQWIYDYKPPKGPTIFG